MTGGRRPVRRTAVALPGVFAVLSAPVALADEFTGTYHYDAPSSGYTQGYSTTWTVTPCGTDCVHVTTASGATDTDAHREGPYWVFLRYVEEGVNCGTDQTTMRPRIVPALMRYTLNPEILVGQFQADGSPCGAISMPARFTLTKLS